VTANIVARFSKAFGAGIGDITARWEEIVGAKTARMCTPIKLTGRGANGVLHVAAPGPAALLVDAESARIIERVNTYCGRDVARRLAITRTSARRAARAAPAGAERPGLAPTTAQKLEADLASVDDPRLKAALRKLGREALRPTRTPPSPPKRKA